MGPILVVEHEDHAGLDLMAPVLAGRAVLWRPYRGEPAPDPTGDGGWSGLVVLGGSMAAWEDDVAPWLPAVREMMRDGVRTGRPTLGICLGAQLLALAAGGRVERGAAGLEVGTTAVSAAAGAQADPFFGPVVSALGRSWPVRQYHGDAVTGLPPDSTPLVGGSTYPVQGFRVGRAAWGVQYHPEVSLPLFGQWVEGGLNRGEIPAGTDLLTAAAAGENAQAAVAEVHVRAFVSVVEHGLERNQARDPATSLER